MKCEAVDCLRPVLARGLCGLHYKRFRAGHDINDHVKGQQSLPRGGLAKLGLHKHHPFYMAWVNMKTRCDNPKSTQYPWYGAQGITYDERWAQFTEFYRDMWDGWDEGLSLERDDNYLQYDKFNCSWIPLADQAKNRGPKCR